MTAWLRPEIGRTARAGFGWAALLAASVLFAIGQSTHTGSTYEFRIGGALRRAANQSPGETFREIDDPSTGDRWLLVAGHPGGPGRLVLAGRQESVQYGAEKPAMQLAPAGERPVIQAGDTLVLEEHSAVVEARLEAVALGPAVRGAPFKARLKIGGKVVRAVAAAAGRAVLAPEEATLP